MKYSVIISFNEKFLRFFTYLALSYLALSYLADNNYISANSINK